MFSENINNIIGNVNEKSVIINSLSVREWILIDRKYLNWMKYEINKNKRPNNP